MMNGEPLGNDPDFPEHNNGAVLLSNQIARFAAQYSMIKPFHSEHLKAASYYLTLGAECQQRGEYVTLSESKPDLKIKPYESVVLSTDEDINLPRFIVGRWNIRVTMAYEGLLWVGGPQVDPGYKGKLHCPIYNLSSREVTLTYKQPIFTIDFVYTTPFDESKCEKFQLRRRETLKDLDIHRVQSGLVTTAEMAKETLEKTKEISTRVDRYSMLTFIVLSVIIMVVAVLAVGPFDITSWCWQKITFGISIVSLVLAGIAVFIVVRRR